MSGEAKKGGSRNFAEAIAAKEDILPGKHLVEASAGTGKTYSIQSIYARLIMERHLRVSQILVVTFTKAATHELRDRLLRILQSVQRALGADKDTRETEEYKRECGQAEALCALFRNGDAVDADAKTAVDLAIMEFDQAAISTIHGFCERAIARHAFESGLRFDVELGEDDMEALTLIARNWWRENIVGGAFDASAYDPGYFRLDQLIGALQSMSGRFNVTPAEPKHAGLSPSDVEKIAFDEVFREKAATAKRKVNTGTKTFTEAVEKAKNRILREQALSEIINIANSLISDYRKECFMRQRISFNDLLLLMKRALEDETNGEKFAGLLRKEYKAALIDEFQDTDPAQYEIFKKVFMPEDGNGPAAPCFFVGDPKQAIYGFRGGDIFTYSEAKRYVDDDRHFSLPRNFRTTPSLISAINTLFMDGEPSGGDSGRTFKIDGIDYAAPLESHDKNVPMTCGDGGEIRSPFVVLPCMNDDDSIPDAAEKIEWIISRSGYGIPDGEGGYRAVRASDIAVLSRSNKNVLRIRSALEDRGVKSVMMSEKSVYQSQEARWLLNIIRAIASPNERNSNACAILTPLFGLSLEDTGAMMGENGARIASPSGYSDEFSPPSLKPQIDYADFAALFTRANEVWQRHGVVNAMALVQRATGISSRLAAMGNGERALTNFVHLLDLLQSAATRIGQNPAAIVDWLTRKILGKNDEDLRGDSESEQIRLESDDDCVTIMTIHKSKGLEFPIVFMPDIDSEGLSRTARDVPVIMEHDYEDSRLVARPGPGARQPLPREEAYEATRRLYVAFTRAKYMNVLFQRSRKSHIGDVISKANLDEAPFSRSLPGLDFATGISRTGAEGAPPELKLQEAEEVTPQGGGSFSSLVEGDDGAAGAAPAPVAADESDTVDAKSDAGENAPAPGQEDDASDLSAIMRLPASNTIGTCLHEIFEKLDFDASDDAIRRASEDSLRRFLFVKAATDDMSARQKAFLEEQNNERVNAVCGMTRNVLRSPLAQIAPGAKEFALKDVRSASRRSEWEFNFSTARARDSLEAVRDALQRHWGADAGKKPFIDAMRSWRMKDIPKGYLLGFVDLLFHHDGRFYVVDWKSNSLGRDPRNFRPDGIRDEMASHGYFLQYLLYSVAVHKFLQGRLGASYDHGRNFGGAHYVFLRGASLDGKQAGDYIFSDRPSEELLEELAEALGLAGHGVKAGGAK